MFMETGDICVSYRDAKDKREQIKILADLNACKVCEIEKILVENGFEIPMRKGVKKEASKRKDTQKLTWDQEMVERLERYVREGLTNEEIGELFGVSKGNISYQVSFRGLTEIRKEARKSKAQKVKMEESQNEECNDRERKGDTPIDSVYVQHLQEELKARTLECEGLKHERDAAIHSAEVLTDENRQLVETFTVDMGKATNENLTLRKELNAVREELSQRTDVLFKKNIKGLAHLVLCGLKKLSEGHSPYDADILEGAIVGVANMILEVDAE